MSPRATSAELEGEENGRELRRRTYRRRSGRDEDARNRPKTAQNAPKCEHECSKQRRDEDSPGRVELEPDEHSDALDELEVEDMLDDSESDPPFPGDRFSDNEDVI